MKKGELWIVSIPPTNGHEQSGDRPVIILADTGSNIAVVIPLTSNIQALRFLNTIEIEPSKENGLAAKSVALVFQIRAIDKKRLKRQLGMLETAAMRKIENMLKKLLKI